MSVFFSIRTYNSYWYTRVVQKVLSLTQILDLLYISHFCMGLTHTESKTEIWNSLSNLIRNGNVLPCQKYLAMALLSGWGLEFLNHPCTT